MLTMLKIIMPQRLEDTDLRLCTLNSDITTSYATYSFYEWYVLPCVAVSAMPSPVATSSYALVAMIIHFYI